jgi:hypothetical protein
MNYIFQYEAFQNRITKILLIDLYKEIEYHKLKWGNLQREYNEKFLFFNNFFYIDEKNFKKILSLESKDFYDLNVYSFFKKNQLEEFLI